MGNITIPLQFASLYNGQEVFIREWTDLEFGRFQRAVENREKWRKLVLKSSVVPHDTRG